MAGTEFTPDFLSWLNNLRRNVDSKENEKAHNENKCTGIISCGFCQAEAHLNAAGWRVGK